MSNTFLTVNEIAKESLMRLQNNLVMGGLVYTDFSDEFSNKGDTVNVRKPATFVAKDFTNATETQGINEGAVPVKLDKIADVTVEVTSKQLGLNVQDFGSQVIDGAMQALAQKIDADLLSLYKDIPHASGTAGQTPKALADIANAGKVLNNNKVPFGNRRLVLDPEAQASLVVLDAIAGADKSGSTQALRDANIGRVLGLDSYLDQNVYTHTKGTLDAGATGTVDVSTDGTKVTVASGGNKGTVKKGDIVKFADVTGTYVVTSDAEMDATGAGTFNVYPALKEDITTKKITVTGSHVANLGFHRNAFALVNRPQALPMGGAEGYVANYNGLSIRVTMGYNMSSKVNTISFDILYGVKTLDPDLAVRMLG
ncbi:MAG: P22 coat protein [Bacilli bacterium]|nr:P22 coat protein [Bacilli bacterium]